MKKSFSTISPVDGSVYCERTYADASDIEGTLASSAKAFKHWKKTSVEARAVICSRVVEYFETHVEEIAREITWQMGRPITYSPFEVKGFKERATHMIDIAAKELQDQEVTPLAGFKRFIRKEPLGTILVLSPWNYPYLTAVNAIIPAIMAGNTVLLKHAEQTPICAERFASAFAFAEAPAGVFNYLHLAHEQIPGMIADPRIANVAFTGSVGGGAAIQQAIGSRFITAGLELGGKDPAYVAPDAAIRSAAENLVDGAYFNAGQSCCGIERIYVHEAVYDAFVSDYQEITSAYLVGNPLDSATTLGPLVRKSAAEKANSHLKDAIAKGGQALIPTGTCPEQEAPYFNPQAIVNANHDMLIMREESFAPVVGITKVSSDEEAISLMNDSDYGLTASIWTNDMDRALHLGDQIETGTWFMNRCDYLDPALAWTGVKNSGKGCTLSALGYQYLTRPKSFHLKLS